MNFYFFNNLQFFITLFGAQNVPDLASGNTFVLVPISL